MKSRIVYPQLWMDEKFAECKQTTKLLFMYLITNQSLGLSRYSRLSDRRMAFDTGLNTVQIKEAKTELENLHWCFFKEEWIYHNHDCAYVDYSRNAGTAVAKKKEIDGVPEEIKQYFNLICLNKVETEVEQSSNLNNKPETKNQKPMGSARGKSTDEAAPDPALKVLEHFNGVFGTNFTSPRSIRANLLFWLEVYTLDQVLEAIDKSKVHPFWKTKMTPQLLLRRKNPNQEDVDYIGEFINFGKKPTKPSVTVPWSTEPSPKIVELTEENRQKNLATIAGIKQKIGIGART